jgi:hypothetical protein
MRQLDTRTPARAARSSIVLFARPASSLPGGVGGPVRCRAIPADAVANTVPPARTFFVQGSDRAARGRRSPTTIQRLSGYPICRRLRLVR